MFIKEFEIRWDDLDVNEHMGNASYIAFMSHTRMSFLTENGLGLDVMKDNNLGPIALYEHIHYFKEIKLLDPLKVSLEVVGMTEDAQFLKIEHNFYDPNGKNLAFSEILFSWMDLDTRKLGRLSTEIKTKITALPRSERFKYLTKSDIRKDGISRKDISPKINFE